MKLHYAGLTDVGRKRDHNEDSVLAVPEQRLFVVADGMGGHASGEVASRVAVDEIAATFRNAEPRAAAERGSLEARLVGAVEAANRRVRSMSQSDRSLRGMGTTVVAAAIDAAGICIAHVGDSRAYRVRAGSIERLTLDHSLVEMLRAVRLANGGAWEPEDGPPKNVILRAVGVAETVTPDLRREVLVPGDRFVLCSDGLSGMIDDAAICDVVVRHADPRSAAADLVDRANQAGGEDNITAIVLHCIVGER